MLTKNDLQQIFQLLDEQFNRKLTPIENLLKEQSKVLNEHSTMLKEHSMILNQHGTMLKQHSEIFKLYGKKLSTLRQDQKVMLNLLDREQMFQRRRLDRVEIHLGLPPLT